MPKTRKTQVKKNNDWTTFERILGFIELGRPAEWSKTLLNMTLALLMIVYVYSSYFNPIVFILGFLSVALLWSGLYTLNDYTDWRIDSLHKIKKNRPIPSGKVTPPQGLLFSIILILASFGIAFALNKFLLVVCLLAMSLNQVLYTMKPFRLKSRKYFDVISGSMVNPFFRYFSGIVLFIPMNALFSLPTPILPIITVIGMQFSGYSLYRLFSKKHDKKIKMKSSVALLSEKMIKLFSYTAMGIGAISYILLLINGATLKINWLGYLPIQYSLSIIAVLLFAPLLKDAILNPGKTDMKIAYKVTYLLTFVFILANLIILFFLP